MKIAVEGCAHGELEKIYKTIAEIEMRDNIKVDLLLCCGDFQATRNMEDLQTMAVPQKFQDMCTFYKYYSGELRAPILTIFIGGNHEASNYLQELPYGGWVAPNIYYLGYAGVVRVNGMRIAGLSGIYKGNDYLRGRFEFSPYTESTKRSVYHVRQFEVFRLKQLSGKIDIFMSHDWPKGIYNYGNKEQLARFKPFLREEMDRDQLGSKPCEDLLHLLKPSYWFAAHLHCKFVAIVQHKDPPNRSTPGKECEPSANQDVLDENLCVTKFLALDKCLPKRRFLQILDIASENHTDDEAQLKLEYDLEWLTILFLTNHLMSVKESYYYLPNEKSKNGERYKFTPTAEEMQLIRQKFENDLKIPDNFCRTVEVFDPSVHIKEQHFRQPKSQINPQSLHFCDLLGIDDPLSLAMLVGGHELSHSSTLDNTDDSALNDSLLEEQQSSFNASTNSMGLSSTMSPLKRKSNSGLVLPKPSAVVENFEELDVEGNKEVSPLKRKNNCDLILPMSTANKDELRLEGGEEADAKNFVGDSEKYPNADKAGTSLLKTLPDSEGVVTPDIIKTTNLPKTSVKRFKRRNQDIYQEKNEDIEHRTP